MEQERCKTRGLRSAPSNRCPVPASERNIVTSFDIAQLDADFHLKALKKRWFLKEPLGMPDWNLRQKRLIAAHLLKGQDDKRGRECAQALEEEVCRVFGARFCIATASGREAIKLVLLGLGAQAGERVILPSFCCLSVLMPVLELDLEPVLADVKDDLQVDPESVRRVMRPGDRALIVPHLFGGLADMPALVEIARANGAAVIDDAAQAIGLKADWGWAGRGGNAGVFSFGLCKPLNAMGGGAFLTDDEYLYERALKALQPGTYSNPSRAGVMKTWLKTAWRRYTYRPFLYNRLRQQGAQPLNAASSLEGDRRVYRIGALHAQLAASQMATIAARRQQASREAAAFKKGLARIPFVKMHNNGPQDGFPRFVLQTVQDRSASDYASIFSAFLQKGIEVQPTYRPLHRILKDMGRQPQGESCRSESLTEQLICLPFPDQKRGPRILQAMEDVHKLCLGNQSLKNKKP